MEKYIHSQQDKFGTEKQELEDKIIFLREKLSEKMPQSLPHLYTYKEAPGKEI